MERYYGWKNYPTWDIALWLDNDYSSYKYYQERSMELLDEYDGELDEVTYAISKELENDIESSIYDSLGENSGMAADIITWVLNQVDWYEIAEHIVEN